MKILFVTLEPINSSSSASSTNIVLINELCRRNHQVTVLSINNPVYVSHNPKEFIIGNVDIVMLGTSSAYDAISTGTSTKGKIKKIISQLLRKVYRSVCIYNYTYPTAIKTHIDCLKTKEYDLVISTSDPKTSHLLVGKFTKEGLKRKRWIQYWGDPLSGDITKSTIWPDGILKKTERKLFDCADKIVYVSPFTQRSSQAKFPDKADRMFFVPIPSVNSKLYSISQEDRQSLIYCGTYNSNVRNIIPFYNAVKSCSDMFTLKIVGSSDLMLESSTNIEVIPPVEKKEAIRLEEEGDIYVCIMNKSGTQIPGKLYHYATSNKPILVIVEKGSPEIAEYVKSFNRFTVCTNQHDEIIKALLYMHTHRRAEPLNTLLPSSIVDQILS